MPLIYLVCFWKVGFNFITAHSKGLFQKSEATIKDVEANPEALDSETFTLEFAL